MPDIGSNHFPAYGKFQYSPAIEALQEETKASAKEQQEVREKLAKAEPIKDIMQAKYSE